MRPTGAKSRAILLIKIKAPKLDFSTYKDFKNFQLKTTHLVVFCKMLKQRLLNLIYCNGKYK